MQSSQARDPENDLKIQGRRWPLIFTRGNSETIPHDLGKFGRASDECRIEWTLQEIDPYLRTGDPLPASFAVPIVREERQPKLVASYGCTKVAESAASGNGRRKRV